MHSRDVREFSCRAHAIPARTPHHHRRHISSRVGQSGFRGHVMYYDVVDGSRARRLLLTCTTFFKATPHGMNSSGLSRFPEYLSRVRTATFNRSFSRFATFPRPTTSLVIASIVVSRLNDFDSARYAARTSAPRKFAFISSFRNRIVRVVHIRIAKRAVNHSAANNELVRVFAYSHNTTEITVR